MHIPDGFLDVKTAVGTGILALSGLAVALVEARRRLPARKVPLLGLTAAFVFAAQMINFPVAGGTSGHLMGGVLTAALLGPSAAVIVLSAVLIVQCFLLADGGITALGANVFNMAIVGGVMGWMMYAGLARVMRGRGGRVVAAVVAGWASTVLAALACAGELAVSGTVPWRLAFGAMAGVHMLIGVGEGLITAAVLAQIALVRPELVEGGGDQGARAYGALVGFGVVVAVGLAVFVAPFACRWPDGLERAAESWGLGRRGDVAPGMGLMVAGGLGVVVVFVLGLVAARVLVRPEKRDA